MGICLELVARERVMRHDIREIDEQGMNDLDLDLLRCNDCWSSVLYFVCTGR